MLRLILSTIMVLVASSTLAQGQYIVTNAIITKVGNTSGNGPSFWVVAEQGSGPCVSSSGQNNIYFPASAAGNTKIYDRAYAAALAALASGKHVNIYNYVDGSCNTAASIEVMAQ